MSERDGMGGAHTVARRLRDAQREAGISAELLSQRVSNPLTIRAAPGWLAPFRPRIDAIPYRLHRKEAGEHFSVNWLPGTLNRIVGDYRPDVLHLHWINGGFVRLEQLPRLDVPVVWTLHDCWPFTGGCHIPYDCVGYEQQCGHCPKLAADRERDLSRSVWQRKASSWRGWHPTIVAPSAWMAEKARSSRLFRDLAIHVVANGADGATFKPDVSRQVNDTKRILLGSADLSDRNKGMDQLAAVLTGLSARFTGDLEVVATGTNPVMPTGRWRNVNLGFVEDESELAAVYGESDVFLSLSRSENLPTAIIESLACGTAAVAFDTGGTNEILTHRHDGFLVPSGDLNGVVEGLLWALSTPPPAEVCRRTFESRFLLEDSCTAYLSIYRELIDA